MKGHLRVQFTKIFSVIMINNWLIESCISGTADFLPKMWLSKLYVIN